MTVGAGRAKVRSERIAAILLFAVAIGLAANAVRFYLSPPSPYLGNPVQFAPESYISWYFVVFATAGLILAVAVYPFRGRSVVSSSVMPWVSGLDDSSLRRARFGGLSFRAGICGLTAAFLGLRVAFESLVEGPDEGLYQASALDLLK